MPTPKITKYTPLSPAEQSSIVYNIEFVVPVEDGETVDYELQQFLDSHVNTVGRAEVFNRQAVAHSITRAMKILDNRKRTK